MLRVGLTGELGSGKSTVARLLAAHGAVVLSSDEIGRAMMEPGEPVYRAIVERFGATVMDANGKLERAELTRLAFAPDAPRVTELNAIVHPAVIAEQERRIAALARTRPDAIVVIESALIFSADTDPRGEKQPWRMRFDCIMVVIAPAAMKVERFLARAAAGRPLEEQERATLLEDAERRLAMQAATPVPAEAHVLQLANDGSEVELRAKVEELWKELQRRASALTDEP